jgi:membrane-associated PAP2 superfamily phosphatase
VGLLELSSGTMDDILNGNPAGLMILGFGIFLSVCFFAWIWKNNPKLAKTILIVGIIVALILGLDWEYIKEKVFVTPEGNLGELADY